MMKKIISLLLAAAIALSLCACGSTVADKLRDKLPGNEEKSSREPQRTERPGTTDYTPHFDEVWRDDVKFSDIKYVHYLIEWFDEYTAPMYDFAENGGEAEAFSDADYYLIDELYYIHTLMTVKDLEYASNPSNAAVSNELAYIQDVFYAAYEEYYVAMHTLAVSSHVSLMEEFYADSIVEMLAAYEPDDGSGAEKYSEENALVQEYYRLMASDEPDWDAIAEVYVKLVKMRQNEAELYGYDSYADYAYDSLYYKDYSPEDAKNVLNGVKKKIVPVVRRYKTDVLLEANRLSDADSVDCSSAAILAAMDGALYDMSPELYAAYEYMLEYELYDIEPSPYKADGGYTTTLYYVNQPFIFNAACNEFYDYTDMFHEFGHFVNAFYTRSDLLFGLSDNDLCELQSQGMEVMFTHYYGDIFGENADAAEKYLIFYMASSLVDGAMYDEFQQRVYAEEDITAEKVNEIFREVYAAYGYNPYTGCEREWMSVSHNFERPFYYISYCVSALAALELYALSHEDWASAVDKYLNVLALDSEAYYYSEALEESGFGNIFDEASYEDIASAIREVFAR